MFCRKIISLRRSLATSPSEEGYPILRIFPEPRRDRRAREDRKRETAPERIASMSPEQDWPSVWPTARTFHPGAVPLPLHQSYENELKPKVPRGKYANTELQKVPNFLHLTPVAVARHCEALRKFCTKWPKELKADEDCRRHFPVTYIKKDYVHASPTIREPRARIVQLQLNIDDLDLDARAKDKFQRLCAHRFNRGTGEVTIIASACPYKEQNQDYADYLLTAVYYESVKCEPWEAEKPDWDW